MEGENVKKKHFDKDFKVSAVKMITEGGHKASEVARSLGIHANVLYNWKRKFSDCWDNAVAESFFLTLKVELIHRVKFKTREEAKIKIFEYVEMYYNRKRAHSTFGFLSPFDYEKRSLQSLLNVH